MVGPSYLEGRARWLGYAGLLPQMLAVVLLTDPTLRWTAMAGGFGYAAIIFSFLGGVWWGIGVSNPQAPRWIYLAAVMPSLLAFAAYLPWIFGWNWPGPSLVALALLLLLSPVIDHEIGLTIALPDGWLALRRTLSFGLAWLTAALAVVAFLVPPTAG